MDFLINITDSAIKKIGYLSRLENIEKKILRVSVESGGCSGLQYKYEFTSDAEEGDAVIQKEEITIVVDQISQEFLHLSTLDYIENLGSAYFEIRNPQATAKCGCGNSFAL